MRRNDTGERVDVQVQGQDRKLSPASYNNTWMEENMEAIRLRTEYMSEPIGIDIENPLLQWNCQGGRRQTGFEVEAYLDPKGDRIIWRDTQHTDKMSVYFAGEIQSRQRIYWRVRLTDEEDRVGPWSRLTFFEMGLLQASDWRADWIMADELENIDGRERPAHYMRRRFAVEKGGEGRLYAACRGLYRIFINGQPVTEQVLMPGSANYDAFSYYQTFDVTQLLQEGENEMLAVLGEGWYRGCQGLEGVRRLYGDRLEGLFQLEVDKKAVCISDDQWEATTDGPIRYNDMQQGEWYDARKKLSDARWKPVIAVSRAGEQKGKLCCSNAVPIREHERIKGRLIQTPNRENVLDFGQNLAGYVEIHVKCPSGRIRLVHGETLDAQGNFTIENFQDRSRHKEGGIRQEIVYTCGTDEHIYKPSFSIFGFRYVRVETDMELSRMNFTAVAVYSDMGEMARFHCGHKKLEQFVKNSMWSMKSNFCDVPTDCPTRERAAWTGDIGVFAPTALSMMECYTVLRKWLAQVRSTQFADGRIANISPRTNIPNFFSDMLAGSVGWGDACILVPYTMYRYSGDKRILEENYGMMRRWFAYLMGRARQCPPEQQERSPYEMYTIDTGVDYGEWLEPGVDPTAQMRTPQVRVATAYLAYSANLMSKIAQIIGQKEAKQYRASYEMAKSAFRWEMVEKEKMSFEKQAEYVRALAFNLLDKEEAKEAAERLNRLVIKNGYHLNTGFLSTHLLCEVLDDYGYTDTAIRLLLQEEMPGWLYSVTKGATTVWETWNGINMQGNPSQSLNHYAYGAVCGWIYRRIGGISYEENKVLIAPLTDQRIGHVSLSLQTPFGMVRSGWRINDTKDTFIYDGEIPANMTGELHMANGTVRLLQPGRYYYQCSCNVGKDEGNVTT